MSRWVKLHAKISESYDFAEVHAEDKNAALLFLLALPQADVFGILPGHSAILKGKLCSMLDITEEQVSNAFNVLVSHKLLIEYTDSNHRRLYIIPKYAAYQDTRWGRISTPEYELPEGWEPPAELLASIEKYPESDIAKWWQSRQKKTDKTQCAGLLPDYSRTTPGLLPDKSRPETETEKETEKETDKDSPQPSEHPDVAAPDLKLKIEVAEEPAPVKPPTPTAQLAEAVWLLFRQELPCSSKVYAAAGQFLQVHGEPGADKFLRWLQVSGLAVVPEGAKPDACIAKAIREGNSQSFKWKDDNPPRRLQMSIGNTQWPKETEVI